MLTLSGMTRYRAAGLVVALLAILVASGCSATAGGVDGFKLGPMVKCSGGVGPISSADAANMCGGGVERAIAALDDREPRHPAIASTAMFMDGTQPGPIDMTGGGPPPTAAPRHPGPLVTVFVFTLADGSVRATGVACQDVAPPTCVGVGSYPH
jgi:hypothetical protein